MSVDGGTSEGGAAGATAEDGPQGDGPQEARARGRVAGYARTLAGHLAAQRGAVTVLAALLLVEVALQAAGPYLLRAFVDGALAREARSALVALAVVYLLAALGGQAVAVLTQYLGARVAWRGANRMRARLVRHCLRLDLTYYHRHPPGELVDRMDGDVTRLANFLSRMSLVIAAQLLLVTVVLVALFTLDWRFGAVYVPFCALAVLLLATLLGRALPQLAEARQAGADLLGFLEERAGATEDIRGCGAGPHVTRELWRVLGRQYAAALRAARATVRWPAAVQALTQVSLALALSLGAWLHASGRISTGTVFAALSYVTLLRAPLMGITTQFGDLEEALVSLRRTDELLAEPAAVGDGGGAVPPRGPLGLEFDRVCFGYPASRTSLRTPSRTVLREVSFALPPGERLALVGPTGSGKSTLARLLFRFHDPDSGAVRLGGRDASAYGLAALRGRVALVPQEVQLLHASLRDNLTFHDPAVTDDRLLAAVDRVGLTPWYRGLDHGLDTLVGDGGAGLSAGEAQLVALVRAFLRDPGLVVFDEVSARLDPHTERLLRRATGRFLHGRTAVVVAHRLETLRATDRVLVLDQGRVREYGRWADLLADPASALHPMLRAGEATL
ncbi:ABC transporter ATP-binding protein [Streptomyces sp. NPDC057654]|uniref:ABC transporter ATP-binding protein n=1 Tax=Streptomyces sp. NPDC057654 TaxID=3346196 RepID=UPI0036AD94AF